MSPTLKASMRPVYLPLSQVSRRGDDFEQLQLRVEHRVLSDLPVAVEQGDVEHYEDGIDLRYPLLCLEDDGDVGVEEDVGLAVFVEEVYPMPWCDDVSDVEGFHETSIPPAAAGFTRILAEVSRNRDASSM